MELVDSLMGTIQYLSEYRHLSGDGLSLAFEGGILKSKGFYQSPFFQDRGIFCLFSKLLFGQYPGFRVDGLGLSGFKGNPASFSAGFVPIFRDVLPGSGSFTSLLDQGGTALFKLPAPYLCVSQVFLFFEFGIADFQVGSQGGPALFAVGSQHLAQLSGAEDAAVHLAPFGPDRTGRPHTVGFADIY